MRTCCGVIKSLFILFFSYAFLFVFTAFCSSSAQPAAVEAKFLLYSSEKEAAAGGILRIAESTSCQKVRKSDKWDLIDPGPFNWNICDSTFLGFCVKCNSSDFSTAVVKKTQTKQKNKCPVFEETSSLSIFVFVCHLFCAAVGSQCRHG